MKKSVSILEVIDDHLNSSTVEVPVFHEVAIKLQQVLSGHEYDIEQAAQLIVADQGLASRVLRVANSSFYAGLSKVSTIHDAIIRLGAREVASITMVATQQDFYYSSTPQLNTVMHSLWKHAFCCAVATRWIAGKCGFQNMAAEAFLAGLLHDVGKPFLLKALEDIRKSGKLAVDLSQALLFEVLDTLHVGHGDNLMKKFNMPEIYCTVVREHHAEQWNSNNHLLAMVRLANKACHNAGISIKPESEQLLFATEEAQVLGFKEITLAELEIVIEDAIAQPMAASAKA